MIFVDLENKKMVFRGRYDYVLEEVLSALKKIAKDWGEDVQKELREDLSSDKFWNSIECDEDEKE
ncbi:hypothetical protein [Campylobacter ureolyticus]|uniref:hypothetical protein n=1 Tax=Campylobacter ureolyticus TaxID=827 RepID=UPI00288BD4AF|nr:hypothetical protein [Campylobacter ureolyticus]